MKLHGTPPSCSSSHDEFNTRNPLAQELGKKRNWAKCNPDDYIKGHVHRMEDDEDYGGDSDGDDDDLDNLLA